MIIKIIFRLAIFKICLLNLINSVDSEGLKEIILNKYEYEVEFLETHAPGDAKKYVLNIKGTALPTTHKIIKLVRLFLILNFFCLI